MEICAQRKHVLITGALFYRGVFMIRVFYLHFCDDKVFVFSLLSINETPDKQNFCIAKPFSLVT